MLYPEDRGIDGTGITVDDQKWVDYLAELATGVIGAGKPGSVYRFGQISIPQGVLFFPQGCRFLSDGSLSGAVDTFTIQGNSTFGDGFFLDTPGTETNQTLMNIGNNVRFAGELNLTSTQQRINNGIFATGDRLRLPVLNCDKIDRPLHLSNPGTVTQNKGTHIGLIAATSYVRGFRADFCEFTVDRMRISGRSPNASKSPGHNGVLIAGCSGWDMGDLRLDDSGEHAFRIGGSVGNHATNSDFTISKIVTNRPGGCAFKINPTGLVSAGVTEKAARFSVGDITATDIGDGDLEGNEELLRLTHVLDGFIGSAKAYSTNSGHSAQMALLMNDCTNLTIGEVGAINTQACLAQLDGYYDVDGVNTFGGPIRNVRIGKLWGSTTGSNTIGINTPFQLDNITIGVNVIRPTGHLVTRTSGPMVGRIFVHGLCAGGSAPTFNNVSSNSYFKSEVSY